MVNYMKIKFNNYFLKNQKGNFVLLKIYMTELLMNSWALNVTMHVLC